MSHARLVAQPVDRLVGHRHPARAEGPEAKKLAGASLEEGAEARVPATWGLEIANVIAKCEARGDLLIERSQAFLAALAAAPIVWDPETYSRTLTDTLDLSRRYRLSAYEASYLELALRATLPLARLDAALQRAAAKAGVKMLKPI
jgi:predicted nucleic acid-binding protein